jgi:ribose 5-phosphate isomerase
MTTVKKIIENLSSSYKSDDHVAVAVWSIEDVMIQAKERGMKITKKQANDVLDFINDKQDATQGINWTIIDCVLDIFKVKHK